MPTRDALGFGILTALLLFVALNLQAGWVYALDALLLGFALAGWTSAYLGSAPLRLRRSMPAEAFEGESITVAFVAEGRGRAFVEVRDSVPGLLAGRVFVPLLRSGAVLRYETTARARGVHRAETAELQASGVTGMFVFRRRISAPGTITVFPRFVPLRYFPLPGRTGTEQRSSPRAARTGLDVAGVRDFREGDDLSRVHWRSTARRGSLVVREFEREMEPGAVLLLDNRPHPGAPETFEDLVRAAASVAHYVTQRGQSVKVLTSRGREPLLETGGWREILHALARVTSDGGLTPQELTGSVARAPIVLFTPSAAAAAALASALPLTAVIADAASYQTGDSPGGALLLEALGMPVRVLRRGEDLGVCLDSRA